MADNPVKNGDENGEPVPQAMIEVIGGPHAGMRFQFDRHETLLVGRATGTRLQLIDDPHFSRHHFLLEFAPPDCYLRDLGSRNGTYVNDRRVKECHLKADDVISGGRTKIRYSVTNVQLPTLPLSTASIDKTGDWAPSVRLHPPPATASQGSLVPPEPGGQLPLPVIPGYEILKPIGQGGMGAVFLGMRKSTRTEVAVKVILPESAANDRAMNYFIREVSILSRLQHPRIVRFHDMGIAHGQFYFVMEYVPTLNLLPWLAKLPLTDRIRLACKITCDLLEGLEYAHNQAYIHRDVKPANVLVNLAGDTMPEAKLADFGLAKNYENAGFSGMTHEGQVLGTYAFMAPEQALNARFAKPSVDIYATAATLYYLLTGAYPHRFKSSKDFLRMILEDDPTPLQQHLPHAPDGLPEVVRRGMARHPPDRFQTASEMADALRPFTKL